MKRNNLSAFLILGLLTVISVPAFAVTLTVQLQGDGAGIVKANNVAMSCSNGACIATFNSGAGVGLTYVADSLSVFTQWGGACSNVYTRTCALGMDSDKIVTMRFERISDDPLRYSIGEPTDGEQLMLELINRARQNPAAEVLRIRDSTDPDIQNSLLQNGVNIAKMVADISAIPAKPKPYVFNAKLLAAARLHSKDNSDDHFGHDGSLHSDRIAAQGYSFYSGGENVYAFGKSVEHSHAAFVVDWSPGGDGMLTAHRMAVFGDYKEAGLGVELDPGNLIFAVQEFFHATSSFISGVAYHDFDGDNFYDIGEGIRDVRVTVDGQNRYALTSNSGGYAVPVPAAGTYTVRFSKLGLPAYQQTVQAAGNVKVDYKPSYMPSTYQSGALNFTLADGPQDYTFSPLASATRYQWQVIPLTALTNKAGAENGINEVQAHSTGSYSVITNRVYNVVGNYMYHLTHPTPDTQWIALKDKLRLTASSRMEFLSNMGIATASQRAEAQISEDGLHWETVWSVAGTNGYGPASFAQISIPLGAWAGRDVFVRLAYVYSGVGSYFSQTSRGVGFHFDELFVTNSQVAGATEQYNSGLPNFQFAPSEVGIYILSVRGLLDNHWSPWGPAVVVSVVPAPQYSQTIHLVPGWNLISNPIDNGAGNKIQDLFKFPNANAGTAVYVYDDEIQSWRISAYDVWDEPQAIWDPLPLILPPGRGVVVYLAGPPVDVVFRGRAPQGNIFAPLLEANTAGKYFLLGGTVTQNGFVGASGLAGTMQAPALNGDQVRWLQTSASWTLGTLDYQAARGWSSADPRGINVPSGVGFWYYRPPAQSLIVQALAAPPVIVPVEPTPAATPLPETVVVTVRNSGTGKGTVLFAGKHCLKQRSITRPYGSSLQLRARAHPGSKFLTWGGACAAAGSAPRCTLSNLTQNTRIEAVFEKVRKTRRKTRKTRG